MANGEKHRRLVDRLVALNGGEDEVRVLFDAFSDDELERAIASAESAAHDIERRGRLGAIWSDGGEMIVEESALVDADA